MNPPGPVCVTIFRGYLVVIKAEVRELRARLLLVLAGLSGVEAGPGVEYERTVGGVTVRDGAVYQSRGTFCQPVHDVLGGDEVEGGRINDLIK